MELPTYFKDFLKEVRLTSAMIDDLKTGHETLRKRLLNDEKLSPRIISTFLQGSYRRSTAVRPKDECRADVDVVVVTDIDRAVIEPQAALEMFRPFMTEWYKGKYRFQGRSIGIELSYVDLDVVVVSAPSEVERARYRWDSVTSESTLEEEPSWRLARSWRSAVLDGQPGARALAEAALREAEWKSEPLWIPDRTVQTWVQTDPLTQLRWTRDKNARCNAHYINVVKAIRWWRRLNPTPKYPKGYPVEHLVGLACPDGIASVAEGVTCSLESIADTYATYAATESVPYVADHGVAQNVLKRVSGEDFADLHALVCSAAKVARRALDAPDVETSANAWREMLGDRFPKPPSTEKRGGFTPRSDVTTLSGGRFA